MSEPRFVRSRVEGATGILTLDHPPVNALSPSVLEELGRAFAALEANAELRAVVVAASGTNAFSAGADVHELAKLSPEDARSVVALGQRTFLALERSRFAVVAAVQALALGGGLELALACDLRVAGERARFAAPEVQLGLVPAWGGTQRLARLVGPGRAKEMILTGAWVNASEALRMGLVNKVVPDGDELRAALDVARLIGAKAAPLAVGAAKRAIREGLDGTLDEGLALEAEAVESLAASSDLREGLAAMLEKRPPKFTGT
ncbi:MAG TPA: enoyl-CoA hydratase-related protein [Candidatus Thermoplasmatota archaeon]|nr:enoyl-CoA hydratase-related protein [Candidatus Thermoplasmatota archaeon]